MPVYRITLPSAALTVVCKIVHEGCFGLKTRVIIIVQKKMIPHMKDKVVFIEKKNQNDRLKIAHFPAPPILNFFCKNFLDWSLGW
jgi:hypothetical protein